MNVLDPCFVPSAPDRGVDQLIAQVEGIILGVNVPFDGVPYEACGNIVEDVCPLAQHKHVTYAADVEILEDYPTVRNRYKALRGPTIMGLKKKGHDIFCGRARSFAKSLPNAEGQGCYIVGCLL